jgi:hypothetical protein
VRAVGIFGRQKQSGPEPEVSLIGITGNRLPDSQVPGRLRVAAVTRPGGPPAGDAALVSGLLLGPFPVQFVQVTVAVPRATWPAPGTELPVVADPANPMNFVVSWAQAADDGTPPPVVWPQGGTSGWDPGPGGEHARAAAEWLAAQGFTAGDFGGGLDFVAPGMTALLDKASSRYASVIRGQASLALMRTGQPAAGVVTAVRPLDMPLQMLPSPQASMAWLTLEVTPQGAAPYPVRIRFGFRSPERFAAIATVGTKLPLRIDPGNPATVTIDLPALGIVPG